MPKYVIVFTINAFGREATGAQIFDIKALRMRCAETVLVHEYTKKYHSKVITL